MLQVLTRLNTTTKTATVVPVWTDCRWSSVKNCRDIGSLAGKKQEQPCFAAPVLPPAE